MAALKSPGRKQKKGKTKTEDDEEENVIPEVNPLEYPGITKIALSPITQIAIGCRVGDDVTEDKPWLFVKKEMFEDNLDLHDESSEFLPIREDILKYPEKDLLMGFDTTIPMTPEEEFYMCMTIDARDFVLKLLDKQNREMEERLKNSLEKHPREWETLGSEEEINENIIQNLRPLIEVEVEAKYPLVNKKVKFAERPVNAVPDGYVELTSERQTFENLYRVRVDAAIQASPDTKANEAQTNPTYPTNTWTQYDFTYKEAPINLKSKVKIVNYIEEQLPSLSDTIKVNQNINLHMNDYENLVKRTRQQLIIDKHEIISFQDVLSCKGKKVSSVSWHPTISGLIAAAYIRNPYNQVLHDDSLEIDSLYDQNLVLLWCYVDTLVPKLFLHAQREVFSISFCPYNPDLLVGGCTNGQVIIWDIKGKLEEVERKECLNPTERKHRLAMQALMKWMKDVKDINVVYPSVICNMDYCHKDKVTKISWLSTKHKVTHNGKVEKLEPSDPPSAQFATSGLDGQVLFWDLNFTPSVSATVEKKTKVSKRFTQKASALTVNVSYLNHLNKIFMPIFKLTIEDAKKGIPITSFEIANAIIQYHPVDTTHLRNPHVRTYFTVGEEEPMDLQQGFTITSSTGLVADCIYEGSDFDQGQKVNSENCQLIPYVCVHDGPVKGCYKNPFFPNLLLTIGGRVFAIWDREKPQEPLFWRKSKIRYVFGLWSSFHPSILATARYDSYFEIWDLTQRTKHPFRVERLSGNVFMDGFTEATKRHTRKNTCCTADAVGALKIYKIPEVFSHMDMDKIRYLMKIYTRIHNRRNVLKIWQEEWIKKYIKAVSVVEIPDAPPVREQNDEEDLKSRSVLLRAHKPDTFDKIMSDRWHAQQENYMYNILLERNRINLAEIERNKKPLQKILEEQRIRKIKQERTMGRKDSIFQTEKTLLLKDIEIERRAKITVDIPQEQNIAIKCSYIQNYKECESKMLDYVKAHKYRYHFHWNAMISQGLERGRLVRRGLSRDTFDQQESKTRKYRKGASVGKLTDFIESEDDGNDKDKTEKLSVLSVPYSDSNVTDHIVDDDIIHDSKTYFASRGNTALSSNNAPNPEDVKTEALERSNLSSVRSSVQKDTAEPTKDTVPEVVQVTEDAQVTEDTAIEATEG